MSVVFFFSQARFLATRFYTIKMTPDGVICKSSIYIYKYIHTYIYIYIHIYIHIYTHIYTRFAYDAIRRHLNCIEPCC